MKLFYGILLLSTISVTACAHREVVAVPLLVEQRSPAQKNIRTASRPASGEVAQKEIGETIIDERVEESIDAIVLKAPVDFPHLNPPRQFPVGMKFLHVSDTPTTRTYCSAHCMEQKNGIVFAAGNPDIVISPYMFSIENVVTDVRQNSFQKHLVYTGRSGKTIFLSYREFTNDMARPAFTQDLTFDISTDRVVGFRGARIEVINATNTIINYRILNGFLEVGGANQPVTRRDGKAVQEGKNSQNVKNAREDKAVVCKRFDGRVETLSEAECTVVGKSL